MTELDLLVDFHLESERQGPGSDTETLRALSCIQLPDQHISVADIGCGTGAQTITLARELNGVITAVDLFPAFLSKLEQRAKSERVQQKIVTLKESMDSLPFDREAFDLLWSEGAIYNIGFQRGIKEWRKFLKPGGFLGLTEITWKTNNRPQEIEEHWMTQYPQIDTAAGKIKQLEENGYSPVAFFFLPDACWMEKYYAPMEDRFETFLEKHGRSEAAMQIVEEEKNEIRLFKQYSNYYGYGFYVARKLPYPGTPRIH